MYTVLTEIEIAAPPSEVRRVFFDVDKYPEWSTGFLKSVRPRNNSNLKDAKPGDKLNVILTGMSFSPSLLENSPMVFKWRGSLLGLVVGDHRFVFEPSTITPGGTKFTQAEEFSGLLLNLFLPQTPEGKKASEGFESFNRELKARVESLKNNQ